MSVSASSGAYPNRVSSVNSTTTPLAAGATFTGTFEEVSFFNSVVVAVLTDQAGTLFIDFSPDATNVDGTVSFTLAAASNEVHRATVSRRYCRIRVTNTSASPQTYLRLQTSYGSETQATAALNATVQQDADAIAVRNIDPELSIAQGKFSGYQNINRYGVTPSFDVSGAPIEIWGGAGVYTGFPTSTLETVSIVSSSANDTSNGTGARTILISGLDGNYEFQSETITLNGTTPVTSVNTYRRLNVAQTQTAGSGGVNAGTITINHSTTTSNVFLIMQIGTNQTNDSAYTVPAGKTGYIRRIASSIFGSNTVTIQANLWIRPFGGVFVRRRPFFVLGGTPWIDEIYGGLAVSEKTDIIVRVSSTSANNTTASGGYDLILVDN